MLLYILFLGVEIMFIKVINPTENIDEIEKLRLDAFYHDPTIYSSVYADRFYKNRMMIIAAYINNELVGGLYFSPYLIKEGYVDQLFVKDEYQNSKYHVGTSLLRYIEQHIQELSDYFDTCFKKIFIEYNSPISEKVYLNAGYRRTRLDGTLVKRLRY